jgi:predicted hotdog family 3-hydroxylacyl-ACP dehydratase
MKRARILELIPHAGPMALIDEVIDWDDTRIVCRATIGQPARHPLAHAGRLSTLVLVEYAAQATAIHSALRARLGGGRTLTHGALAGVQATTLAGNHIPDHAVTLAIQAERRMDNASGAIYGFDVRVERGVGVRGRLSVMSRNPAPADCHRSDCVHYDK